MKSKFEPAVYAALQAAGMSNREVAAQLRVSEAAVRRGLLYAVPLIPPAPVRREFRVIVEEV